MDQAEIKNRIDYLLSVDIHVSGREVETCTELFQGCLTLALSVYGSQSLHVASLQKAWAETQSPHPKQPPIYQYIRLSGTCRGFLENLKREIDAGILGELRRRLAGDVLSDFIKLARNVLDDPGDSPKNVAAVLSAAAFEDALRRMGEAFAGTVGGEDLQGVIIALKKVGILQSPQLGIAQSYLNFRNHALHAEWENIDRSSVHSVLAFVEQLLLKHFQ